METDKIMYDPKRIQEAIVFKRFAFFGIFLATISTFLLIILVPALYNYVQMIQSGLRDELDYCRHNADHLWDEYARVQKLVGPAAVSKLNKREYYNRIFRTKRGTGYDALEVVEANSKGSEPAATPVAAPAAGPTEVSASSGSDPSGYGGDAKPAASEPATSAPINAEASYGGDGPQPAEASPPPSAPVATSAPAASDAPSAPINAEASYGGVPEAPAPTTAAPAPAAPVNAEATFDGATRENPETPVSPMSESHETQTCSCGMGPAGPPGENGPDGQDGVDGMPGEVGKDGPDAKLDEMPNETNMCFISW
uniref:Nematode cuticle collagen N-terminal domain-containing protein n=1 Tax=Panagrolaimus davidi TaxID=227884 RepID=A0A914PE66_9BILA